MQKIELEDFILEVFDLENRNHRRIAVLLDNDQDFHDYVGEMQYLIENRNENQQKGKSDEVYAITHNGEYLGIISLITLQDFPYLAIGIIPEKQGCQFGFNVLREYIEYIFQEYPNYSAIFASINPKNEKSIKNVLKLGFTNVSKTKYIKEKKIF